MGKMDRYGHESTWLIEKLERMCLDTGPYHLRGLKFTSISECIKSIRMTIFVCRFMFKRTRILLCGYALQHNTKYSNGKGLKDECFSHISLSGIFAELWMGTSKCALFWITAISF